MKKFLIVMIVVLLSSSLAWANGLGVYGAYWDTDDAGDGYGPGVKLQISLLPKLSVEVHGTYFQDFGGVDDSDLDIITAGAGLVLCFPVGDNAAPYVGGGAEWFSFDMAGEGGLRDVEMELDDEIGYYGVAGLKFNFGRSKNVMFFLEGKYIMLETEGESGAMLAGIVDDDGDSTLDGAGGNAGIMLTW